MISIITSCVKREFYLKRLIDSIRNVGGYEKVEFEHFIVFQGAPPSEKMSQYLHSQPFYRSMHIGSTKNIEPIGAIVHTTARKAQYPICFKIDDDCTLLSPDFLLRAYELCSKMPRGVIYPAMADGECPLAGAAPHYRQTVFLEKSNIFMTVGKPTLMSGKYLIPTDLLRSIPFSGQKDAEQVTVTALHGRLPVFQAINGLVIETQDGFSGQYHRTSLPNSQEL